ncbi:phage holin family protein [Peptostreptococcus canis]|uniref:Holin n=1 Tax=Peptostreptococcus canis TaxID=1159213 RepID=A0ABR6TIJ0_9FIRM|nr:phage holin family protein [Peptostreptococcus canis]MBC2575227.1 holin [Peptostreptococcus canis]MBP1997596.1 toxin secretion/phage lysis holin [Peptostreptococcus canis]
MSLNLFDFFRDCVQTQESKILFILMIIAIAMIVDFITGTIAAYVNPKIKFQSKAGINGILRKIASMLLLIVFLPVSVLIPGNAGIALTYTLYFGYLLMEVKSIIENVGKNGTNTSLFSDVVSKLSKLDNK